MVAPDSVDWTASGRDHPRVTTEAHEPARTDLPTGRVTFLFTDIEGSTRLSQTLVDGFAAVIDRHHRLLRSAIGAAGGIVVSTEGDAFFAVFTEPAGAVVAAIAGQRTLAGERWPEGADVRVRMGLHTGIGRLGGDDYAGADVNRTSRISSAGHGGQVLLSQSTAEAVAGELPAGSALRDLGAIMLKDFEDAQPVWQLEIDGLRTEFPPLRAERPGYLPEPLTSFVGRDTVAIAVGLVREQRLVTLTGPGGTGKTRISIEAARQLQPEFHGGAWFVRLETIRDRSLVLPEIADHVGVPAVPGRPMLEVLSETIGDRPMLLVLDNLEQVVEAGPDLAQLLERTPGLRILASSREPLRVSGEQELPVPVLDPDLSVELFIERARRVRPSFDPTDGERTELRDLVARLDHLPLAIELAAARARHLSVAALCEQVPARLVELDSGQRDAVDRQRTLRGAVAWSYDLLGASERRTFDRLGVFAGGAELGGIGEVVDPDAGDWAVLDDIDSLADKSLLAIREGPAGAPRTRMLETIHAFAVERLAQDPELAVVRERHARRVLVFCDAIEPELLGERAVEALERTEAEHDNIRAALDWSLEHDPAVGLRIGGAIWRFWQQRSHMQEGQRRIEALMDAAADDTDAYALGRGWTAIGGARYWLGDYRSARRAYEEAVACQRESGDEEALARALYDLSYPVAIEGDTERAAVVLDESHRTFARIDDQEAMILVREGQAVQATIEGDFERARELQLEVLAHHRRSGGLFKLSDNIGMLVMLESRLGLDGEARTHLAEVRDIQRRLHDRSGLGGGLEIRALLAVNEGDDETAALCHGAVQGMRDRGATFLLPSEVLGLPPHAAAAKERLGQRYDVLFEAGRTMDPEEVFLTDGLAAEIP